MNRLLRRIASAYVTWPSARGWLEYLILSAAFAVIALAGGIASGFLQFQPVSAERVAWTALIVFFTPALVEETLFRSWLPDWKAPRRWLWIGGSTAVFVIYHFVLLMTVLPGADVFLRPEFLISAAGVGLCCAVLRMRSGSIWPAVLFHWSTDVVWLTLFSGPYLNRLLG